MIVTNSTYVIFDYNKKTDIFNWKIINDAVMGGKSKSTFYLNEEGEGTFEGTVSTENNGGFSFLRHRFEKLNISEFSTILLQIKGDGKKYQFRMKSNKYDQHSYVADFQTTNKWQLLEIPLAEFAPTFRGRKLNMDKYNGEQIEEIGFLIGNKSNEQFKLLIKSISFK